MIILITFFVVKHFVVFMCLYQKKKNNNFFFSFDNQMLNFNFISTEVIFTSGVFLYGFLRDVCWRLSYILASQLSVSSGARTLSLIFNLLSIDQTIDRLYLNIFLYNYVDTNRSFSILHIKFFFSLIIFTEMRLFTFTLVWSQQND